MIKMDIHADDFGVSLHASKDILELLKKGALDSISIMPNMQHFEECMGLLGQAWEGLPVKPKLSVHLNFMEGHCCCDPGEVAGLVDDFGYFNLSWGELLKLSYVGGRRREVERQLQKEIARQLHRVWKAMPKGCALRIDSHQHTHMIPIVFRALLKVVDGGMEKYPVTFIRNAQEPIIPYLRRVGLYRTYSPVNLVKNLALNLYSVKVGRLLRKRGIDTALLWGVLMSGYMDGDRMEKLYPLMKVYGERKKKGMEVLFHPGSVLKEEIGEEFVKKGFVGFHLSEGRRKEYEAVLGRRKAGGK